MKLNSNPVAVLAGTYLEYLDYAREHPSPRPIFCDCWPCFAGYKFSSVVEVGTFRKRPDALDLWQRVLPMVHEEIARSMEKETA